MKYEVTTEKLNKLWVIVMKEVSVGNRYKIARLLFDILEYTEDFDSVRYSKMYKVLLDNDAFVIEELMKCMYLENVQFEEDCFFDWFDEFKGHRSEEEFKNLMKKAFKKYI